MNIHTGAGTGLPRDPQLEAQSSYRIKLASKLSYEILDCIVSGKMPILDWARQLLRSAYHLHVTSRTARVRDKFV